MLVRRQWPVGTKVKNIPVERGIEDPVFKKSHQSYFIQLADAVAFALLKREVEPTPRVKRYGIDGMFYDYVAGVCFKAASPKDPLESSANEKGRPKGPSTVGRLPLQAGRPPRRRMAHSLARVNGKCSPVISAAGQLDDNRQRAWQQGHLNTATTAQLQTPE